MVYLPEKDTYSPVDEVPRDQAADISGPGSDDYLAIGIPLPEWFKPPGP